MTQDSATVVAPAQAGAQVALEFFRQELGPGLRRGDGRFDTWCTERGVLQLALRS
jgi:hypothetical protein